MLFTSKNCYTSSETEKFETKGKYTVMHEKQLRKDFSSFSALIEQIAEFGAISPEFIDEIEMAVHCLGIILIEKDPRFSKFRREMESREDS